MTMYSREHGTVTPTPSGPCITAFGVLYDTVTRSEAVDERLRGHAPQRRVPTTSSEVRRRARPHAAA